MVDLLLSKNVTSRAKKHGSSSHVVQSLFKEDIYRYWLLAKVYVKRLEFAC